MKTPFGEHSLQVWDQLFDSNVKGAYFLSEAVAPWLRKQAGSMVAITDIHAIKPMRDYSIYCMAKAALAMMVKVLAKELAPDVRVNAVAPGVAALPEKENALDETMQAKILSRIPLARFGSPDDIARAVWFLVADSPYMTGQVLTIDGGRSLYI